MRTDNDYSMYQYLRARDKGDDRVLIAYQNTYITTNTLFDEIDKMANILASMGIGVGDNIAICLPNIPNAIMAFYAANKIGAVVNLIHPLVPPHALKSMVESVGSKILLLFDLFYPEHREVVSELGIPCVLCGAEDYLYGLTKCVYRVATHSKSKGVVYGGKILKYTDLMANNVSHTDGVEHYAGIGDSAAAYIHSGGTTGEPKIAILSNRAVNDCSYNVRWLIGDEVKKGESMLMVLPLFHIFGLGVCMHTTLTAGAKCLLVPRFKPKAVAKMIRRERATYLAGVPSMYDKLLRERAFRGEHLKAMKCAYCGGDKLNRDIKERFDSIMQSYGSSCRLCEGYGLTEAGICTVNVTERALAGSVGQPIGMCRVCVVDENNQKLPPNISGEICIGGDNIMSGYYGDPDTTSEVLFEDEKGESWVKTGDYGYLAPSGHLFYRDRIKRMLKVSGVNVFPTEIERIVCDHVREVDMCCAVECKYEGKVAVELVYTLAKGAEDSPELQEKILEVLRDRLMKYSIPRKLKCVNYLPMTNVGKVDYKKLTIEENLNENQ